MQKGGRERESKKKEKRTETTVLWTPVPFAHKLERCTETAAGAIKKKDFLYLPLLPLFQHCFYSFASKMPKEFYCRNSTLSCYIQLHRLTRCTVCSHKFFWAYIIHGGAQSLAVAALMFRLRALLALGRRTDATTKVYNTSPLVCFTIANHNCRDTISSLYLAVINAYYTSFSVYIPHSNWLLNPNESLKCPDWTTLLKGSSRVLIF